MIEISVIQKISDSKLKSMVIQKSTEIKFYLFDHSTYID